MQTNKLLYIIIGLQAFLIISFFVMHFSGMRHHKNMESCSQGSSCMMKADKDGAKGGPAMMDHSMHGMKGGSADMQGMMMNMTERMKGKTGDELDKVFLEDMIIHHQGAVDMAVELQKGTARPELQKMATDIIDVQTKEIDMMKTWLGTWF
jgi:uncharacterized protein (DUF305 family)